MSNDPTDIISSFGHRLENRLVQALDARPLPEFDALLDLHNLAGKSTGYAKVFNAPRIEKASSLSINLAPGVRYFNFHVIPDAGFDVPRFSFEGMLSPGGSQVSMDLYPDRDLVSNLDDILEQYASVAGVYEQARQDERFLLQPSRLMHMRAMASPVFLLVFGVEPASLGAIEHYGEQYFDAWLELHSQGNTLSSGETKERRAIRQRLKEAIVRLDPDRHLVVQVYGEETTRLIEAATL